MRLLKQICSIALSAGMVLSPVASVMAAEGVTQTAQLNLLYQKMRMRWNMHRAILDWQIMVEIYGIIR